MTESILYNEENNNIYIRALGRITANICFELRDRVFARLNSPPTLENIYIDLSRCDYMDSTFMGIILGINKKMRKFSATGVTVVCPTEECSNLFLGLNILQLLTIQEKLVAFPGEMEIISQFKKPMAEIVLHAHDDLMEVSEVNAEKFKLLRDILQKKVIEERKKETEKNIEDDEADDEGEHDPLTDDPAAFFLDD